ncbi:MAG TPA: glycosyltransferase family 39 protein [Polyangiaceae bacterium]
MTRSTRTPREVWLDRGLHAFAIVFGLMVWWPTRELPYHWDSATFVVDSARDLLATGFHPLVATHSDFAHPPLFVALLALAWKLFGESRLVAHLLVLPALPAAMMATYRLGVWLGDRTLGVAAALLFGGVAVVVAEYGQIYMDLPIAALLAWGLVAWVHERRALAGVLFCAAALMKIPAPLTVPAALLVVTAARRESRRDPRAYASLLAPIVAVAVWLAYHAAVTGWVLWRPGRIVAAPQGLEAHAQALWTVLAWLMLGQWRWVLFAAAGVSLAWLRFGDRCHAHDRRNAPRLALRPLAPLAAPLLVGWLFFGAVGEFGLRYGIYLLPPYLLLTLACVRAALPRSAPFTLGATALFALFVTTWHPRMALTSTYSFRPDENLAYLDVIDIGLRSAHWLEQKHPDAEIYGAGPEAYQLPEPWQGYVDAPLDFRWCITFARHPGVTQIVYVHGYHRQQLMCRRIVEALGAKPVKHFEANGKWLELYLVPPVEPQEEGAGTK